MMLDFSDAGKNARRVCTVRYINRLIGIPCLSCCATQLTMVFLPLIVSSCFNARFRLNGEADSSVSAGAEGEATISAGIASDVEMSGSGA